MVKKLYPLCFASIAMFFIAILIATFAIPSAFRPFNKNIHGNIERLLLPMEYELGKADTLKELTDAEINATRRELARYRAAPKEYVSEVTQPAPEISEIADAIYPVSRGSDQIVLRTPKDVQHIVQHGYQLSMSLYIADLRILTGSNAVVAVLGLVIALLVRGRARTMTYLLLLFVGPCIFASTYVFYDWAGDSFLRIGPYYPLVLGIEIVLVVGFVSIEFYSEWLLHKGMDDCETSIENESEAGVSQE